MASRTQHEDNATYSLPTAEDAPRSRNRVSRACLPCHSAKRKCNRARPCSQCLRRQITGRCIYESVTESDLEALANGNSGLLSENQVLRSRVGELETAIAALRGQLRQTKTNAQAKGRKRRRGSDASINSQNDREGKYYGRSIYLGGPAAPDLLQRMMPLLPADDQPDLLLAFSGGSAENKLSNSTGGFSFPTIFPSTHTAQEMLHLLSEIGHERADNMVDSFFELVDPIYHYVPSGWFYQRYHKCWDALNAQGEPFAHPPATSPLPQELALVYVILGLGDLVTDKTIAHILIPAAMQLLRISNFLASPSLDTLHTMCFFAVYLQHQGKLFEYWPLVGMVVRLAQSMALHRDPSRIQLPAEEGEIRRRLFWTIVGQETGVSLMFGRPHALGFYDCKIPLDISDEKALDDQVAGTLAGEPGRNEISYNRYTWEVGEITRDMIQSSFSSHDPEESHRTRSYEERLRRWYAGLPSHFKVDLKQTQSVNTFDSQSKKHYVQSLLLHIIFHHNILVLFRKSLLNDTTFEHDRPCFEAAFEIIAAWKVLHDDFPKMAKVAWMHVFRAFHASLICLMVFKSDKWRAEYQSRAMHAWLCSRRIFERLKDENEGLLTCWRALKRLDAVLKVSSVKQNSQQNRKARAFSDSPQRLLMQPAPDRSPNSNSPLTDPSPAATIDNCPRPSPPNGNASFWPANPSLDANVFDPQVAGNIPDFQGISPSAAQILNPSDILPYSSDGLDFSADPELLDTIFGQQESNLFNMDFQNWPTWLTDDNSPPNFLL